MNSVHIFIPHYFNDASLTFKWKQNTTIVEKLERENNNI